MALSPSSTSRGAAPGHQANGGVERGSVGVMPCVCHGLAWSDAAAVESGVLRIFDEPMLESARQQPRHQAQKRKHSEAVMMVSAALPMGGLPPLMWAMQVTSYRRFFGYSQAEITFPLIML